MCKWKRSQNFWIVIYLIMNIAAVAIWTAWYTQRTPERRNRTTTHETGQAPGEGRATGAFALAQRMAALLCGEAQAMEARPPFSLRLHTMYTATKLTRIVSSSRFPAEPAEWDDQLAPVVTPGVYAVLFPDRSVYHCGETLALSGLVRDDAMHSIPGMPLEISLITEQGRMIDQAEVWTDDAGRVNVSTVVAADAPIGLFVVEAKLPGGGATVGETIVRIEPCPLPQP